MIKNKKPTNAQILAKLEEVTDFNYAIGEECIECDKEAYGAIYFWCGDSDCCAPPSCWYCKDCLVKMEGHLVEDYFKAK